jgi:dynamin 1-like protein
MTGMDQLIPIASKLQDVLGALGQTTELDLPQIVVVGGQSSGKSSVLESIVGRSFLPRGHGIVTRRPLVLQLYNTSDPGAAAAAAAADQQNDSDIDNTNNDDDSLYSDANAHDDAYNSNNSNKNRQLSDTEEWGEFLHQPGRKFFDFGEIRDEIVRDTNRLTGSNKGINPTPIHLKIYSPRVLALTMVDLPGIAKVAVGDQPEDIERQLRDMCEQYISNPNAIILAVTSANTDLANSDALKLVKEMDPMGERTLGVLTKLDLMDPGTDASDILLNKVIPLRKGYIGVVNRGQLDVESDLCIRDGLEKERHFFRNHPTYGRDRSMVGRLGTDNLAKQLNSVLMHHIRDCLPDLKTRIANMTHDVQMELEDLGTCDSGSRANLSGSLLALLSRFTTNFTSTIEGRGNVTNGQSSSSSARDLNGMASPMRGPSMNPALADMNELFGGARISYIFNDIFAASLMSVAPFDGLSDQEIRTTICNANGTRPSLFVPEISFDILVRRQISRLEQPGLQCVDLVYEELQRIASQCEPGELTRFPNLRERLTEVVSGQLKRSVNPTQTMVSNLVKVELAYINTSHPDFVGGSRAVAQLMRKLEKEKEEARAKARNLDAMGATPLSSSSLNSYMGVEKENTVNGSRAPPLVDSEGSGGILNFMFGRGKTPTKPAKTIFRTSTGNGQGPPSIVQLPQVPATMRQTDVPPTDREKIEMEIIKILIESYFNIVRKNFIDMVPKTIMYFLVNHVSDAMQNELVAELYRDVELPTLMKEADDVAQRRQICVEMKTLLTKALEIVDEVREFNTFA